MSPEGLKAKILARILLSLVIALTILMTACGDISTPTVPIPTTVPVTASSIATATNTSAPATTTSTVASVAPTTAPTTTAVPPSITAPTTTSLHATTLASAATPAASVPAWNITAPLTQDEKEVSFTAGNDLLYATLLVPNDGKTGKNPAVLIVPGGGPFDRNGSGDPKVFPAQFNTYLELTRELANLGVVSLRYDKLTTGKTGLGSYTSHPNDVNYPLYVDEARAAYDFLKTQPEVDPTRIMLLGHSEGGLTALLVTEQLKSGGGPKLLMLAMSPAVSTPELADTKGIMYNPVLIAANISPAIPVLLICGEKDTFVSCTQAKPYLQTLENAGNKDVSFYQIANMNHLFKDIPGEVRPYEIEFADMTLKYSTEFISTMTNFVKTKL